MPRDIRSVTLMVCTHKRPRLFARCLASVREVRVPAGITLTVAIADNNPASEREGYVAAPLASLRVPSVYGHQPERGYSNARNLGLELGLGTGSDVLAFVDDDLVIDPGWLEGLVETYRTFECDAVGGAVLGQRKVPPHGSVMPTSSMANFSFLSELAAPPPSGLGLRFDAARNLVGNEDLDFSRAMTDAGRRIMISTLIVVTDPEGAAEHALDDAQNRAAVTAAMTHNRIVDMRRAGDWPRVALVVAGSPHLLVKAGGNAVVSGLSRLAGRREASRAKAVSARKDLAKFRATFTGLVGETIARQDVRRNG